MVDKNKYLNYVINMLISMGLNEKYVLENEMLQKSILEQCEHTLVPFPLTFSISIYKNIVKQVQGV